MKKLYCLVALLSLVNSQAVIAQNYQSSHGGARVINQSANGLAQPSSSYIGPGTISKSAQGYNSPATVSNPGLPAVNMGANIRTPGDNLYRPKQPSNNYYQAPRPRQNNTAAQQHYYQPGQNNQSNTYRRSSNSNSTPGTATYAEHGYGGDGTTRQF